MDIDKDLSTGARLLILLTSAKAVLSNIGPLSSTFHFEAYKDEWLPASSLSSSLLRACLIITPKYTFVPSPFNRLKAADSDPSQVII
jgi:hypothetical protein